MLILIQSWDNSQEDLLITILGILTVFIIIGGYIGICAAVGKYAKKPWSQFLVVIYHIYFPWASYWIYHCGVGRRIQAFPRRTHQA